MFRVFPQTLIQRMTGLVSYLQSRADMHSLAYLNKQNKKSLLATEGMIQMALLSFEAPDTAKITTTRI
jgi:hypothetical protein